MKKTLLILCGAALVLFNSCLGVSADISINADGSGKIALEYRVSQMLESMGRLDGNESRPAIPVGRDDFERSAARIPGLRLTSFSSKNVDTVSGGRDLVTKAVLQFSKTAALLAFLDSTGVNAVMVQDGGTTAGAANCLRLVLVPPSAGIKNPDLLSLLRAISEPYTVRISLSAPSNANLTLIPATVPSARMVPQGKKVSLAIGMGELLVLNEGLTMEIAW